MQHEICRKTRAFTLIELSIVLVVIGLIVGGVLVGRDLIKPAEVRSLLTQIEQYQQAVNTFRGKYEELPGDISAAAVIRFGFTAAPIRAGIAGRGDGNGELNGFGGLTIPYSWQQSGENLFFWEDLSTNSKLIDGSFNTAVDAVLVNCAGTACNAYFPAAKTGANNSIYVYSGYAAGCCADNIGNGPNFFGVSSVLGLLNSSVQSASGPPNPGLTVAQAYKMDAKMDDGLPTRGNVLAQQLGIGGAPRWCTSPATPDNTSCFHGTTKEEYSIATNNGAGVNCSLSFKFQ